jgi:hypothetical protein
LRLLFPHWLILIGVLTSMFGFVGLAFHRNKHNDTHLKEVRPQSRAKANELTSQLVPVERDLSQMRSVCSKNWVKRTFLPALPRSAAQNIGREYRPKLARP